MLSYYQSRINDSIPDCRASFKNYDAIRPQPNSNEPDKVSISDDSLSVLQTLLFDSDNYDTSTLEKLVTESYNLRQTRSIKETLNSSPSATSKSKKLWLSICILARLRVVLQSFKVTTLTLPSFEDVTIILVPNLP